MAPVPSTCLREGWGWYGSVEGQRQGAATYPADLPLPGSSQPHPTPISFVAKRAECRYRAHMSWSSAGGCCG
jgi:hypothetical protein